MSKEKKRLDWQVHRAGGYVFYLPTEDAFAANPRPKYFVPTNGPLYDMWGQPIPGTGGFDGYIPAMKRQGEVTEDAEYEIIEPKQLPPSNEQ